MDPAVGGPQIDSSLTTSPPPCVLTAPWAASYGRTLCDVRIAISGSNGFIGSALVERLGVLGHDVVRIVRSAAEAGDISWDRRPVGKGADLIGVDAVVNLAGAGVGDKRWTEDYKRQIKESRTKSTALLSATIAPIEAGRGVLLSASGVHVYGDRGDEEVDEPRRTAPGSSPRCAGSRRRARHPPRRPACGSPTCESGSCWRPAAARWRRCCRCSSSVSAGGSAQAGSG